MKCPMCLGEMRDAFGPGFSCDNCNLYYKDERWVVMIGSRFDPKDWQEYSQEEFERLLKLKAFW